MKKYIFILFLPCFCLLSYGQITIEGQVVNKTGLPIAKPQCLPQISQMTQTNPKTKTTKLQQSHEQQTVFICEIMQLAAFPLRDLRNLRENNHMRVLKLYCTNETPMSPADLADDADEPQNQDYKIATITRTTNCLSLRNNAALLYSSA